MGGTPFHEVVWDAGCRCRLRRSVLVPRFFTRPRLNRRHLQSPAAHLQALAEMLSSTSRRKKSTHLSSFLFCYRSQESERRRDTKEKEFPKRVRKHHLCKYLMVLHALICRVSSLGPTQRGGSAERPNFCDIDEIRQVQNDDQHASQKLDQTWPKREFETS